MDSVDTGVDRRQCCRVRLVEVVLVGLKGDETAAQLGPRHSLPPLQCFLSSHLILVVFGEVVDNNRDGQCDDQYPADAAEGADQLAPGGFRVDVAVAHRGHGDDCPPKSLRYALEHDLILIFFCTKCQTGEHKDPYGHKHD